MSTKPEDAKITLPPQTAPANLSFAMRAFASIEDANRVAHKLASYIRLLSSMINLERLDGVTVAYDYDAALAELDRGVEGLRRLARSNDDQLVGVAMSPAVLRDGKVKVHLVFSGAYIENIDAAPEEDDTEAQLGMQQAIYLIAHECAHVQVTTEMDEAFPGTILQKQVSSYEEQIFTQINEACWDEYAACRLSAAFGSGQLAYYEEGLRGVAGVARQRAAAARDSFWTHRDLNRIVGELGAPMSEPLRMAAYTFGHIDGSDGEAKISEETRQAIEEAGYTEAIEELVAQLRKLWDQRGEWMFPSEFDVLGDVARGLFYEEGLLITPNGEGANIQVWDPAMYDGPVAA
ncbi:MAG: hypothetical protein E5X72_10705 [Mesorhizobium sp.]|uniref:hypothetical protein n=1 Tax=Mesorhizobium sp. TaxID=1871066 RepID=UPI00121C5133|nr:hypothetical protein [Mesorhizobium sp.]TIP04552.1 MAG: hypothetical protein E5X72_10705 [Mesorhizobium sp.]